MPAGVAVFCHTGVLCVFCMTEDAPHNYDKRKSEVVMEKASVKKNKMDSRKRNGLIAAAVATALVILFVILAVVKFSSNKAVYFKVGDYEVNKLEYNVYFGDYYSQFVTQNKSYLSYFGLDTSKSLESQTYSGERTWNDYFMEQAVNNIQDVYTLYDASLKDDGFTADIDDEMDEQMDSLKESADSADASVSAYLQSVYGDGMTEKEYRTILKRQLTANDYYEYLKEQETPTDEELEEEYKKNIADYSMVSFRAITETYSYDSDASEDEKKKAKDAAKAKAEAALKDMSKADLTENYMPSSLISVIKTWLLEDGRKAGDTAVLEDTSNKSYYAIEFISLERNTHGTVSWRQILFSKSKSSESVAKQKAETTLEFWKNSDTGEAGFIELTNKVSDDTMTDGLYQNIYYGYMLADVNDWLFDEARQAGDTTIINSTSGSYILYFVSRDDEPYWKTKATDTLQYTAANEKESELEKSMTITDKYGNLTYLTRKTAAELNAEKATSTDAEK